MKVTAQSTTKEVTFNGMALTYLKHQTREP
jgi:hypothetical protein